MWRQFVARRGHFVSFESVARSDGVVWYPAWYSLSSSLCLSYFGTIVDSLLLLTYCCFVVVLLVIVVVVFSHVPMLCVGVVSTMSSWVGSSRHSRDCRDDDDAHVDSSGADRNDGAAVGTGPIALMMDRYNTVVVAMVGWW